MILEKIGIVVLNYNNYEVTIECLKYISKQSVKVPIVIVDNGSSNNSAQILLKQFMNTSNVYVVKSRVNVGFSRGNNIGIKFLRDLKCVNILVLNSDVFLKDSNYISNLTKYVLPNDVAVVGTAILDKKGINQNPTSGNIRTLHLYLLLLNLWRLKLGISSFGLFSKMKKKIYHPSRPQLETKDSKFPTQILDNSHYLHGSSFVLTEEFFKNFEGLYNKTFLYFEEPILHIGIKKAGLKMFYISELSVLHLEDQSSNTSFQQHSKRWINYSIHGVKELIYVKGIPLNLLKSFMKVEKHEPIN
ncbi:glycosyltransferase family 2 protein [Leuconostoc gelidum subsp. gasicomitatum]|uniref:glycosyltransferase n=1 Tax=Leuconostoc gasicomitatum TaxID=115778 RepID=UPI001CC74F1D|nr:glycosyltransferase [Leuconostoc gasicomitatum]MBZ5957457.1 glycosyltransferase family 2 protein [Leuconostoc gasicomitatum]